FIISPQLPKNKMKKIFQKYTMYCQQLFGLYQQCELNNRTKQLTDKIDSSVVSYHEHMNDNKFLLEANNINDEVYIAMDNNTILMRSIARSMSYIRSKYYRHALQKLFMPYQNFFKQLQEKHAAEGEVCPPDLPDLNGLIKISRQGDKQSYIAFLK